MFVPVDKRQGKDLSSISIVLRAFCIASSSPLARTARHGTAI
jgi:hypothetical protein